MDRIAGGTPCAGPSPRREGPINSLNQLWHWHWHDDRRISPLDHCVSPQTTTALPDVAAMLPAGRSYRLGRQHTRADDF
jgi:hypothetical protein